MTVLVLDASSAVHFLRADPVELARIARIHDAVVVPSIFDYEVANATLRMLRRGAITPGTADRMVAALADLPANRVPAHSDLLSAALTLTGRLTLADAIYLALAQSSHADLITVDRALAEVALAAGVTVIAI